MKNRSVCVLLLAAVCTLSYAQDDHGQGDEQGHPAVPKTGQGAIRPHVWIRGFVGSNANPAATTLMTPALMTAAYGIHGVGSGQGATVAIVDAYDAPNVAADLATFMSTWGISCPTSGWGTFTKVNQNGRTSPLPSYDSGWEVETSMDTQWVRAIAPCANIVLVEANSSLDSDLMSAVSTAATLASVVSMSWGGSESGSQTFYDSFFVKNGVTFLASSGDTGGIVEWPSSSPNVIAVGGTNLNYSNGTLVSETAWSGSGGGCSTVEPAIAAQTGFVPSSCKNRATPDVSIDGGGISPVYVLISGQGGWYSVYGTSLSVQLWAGVTALANALHGAPLNGVQSALYADAAGAPSSAPYTSNYRDITSGSAGSFSAGPGWDFVTGLGSPLVNALVLSLIGPPTANFTLSAAPSSQTVTQGNPASYTATVTPSNGFTGSVALSASGLPAGATATFSPTSIAGGSGSSTMSVTTSSTTPAGTYTLTITGTSGALSHSTTVTLVVNSAVSPNFSISASPASRTVTQGNPTSYTATVTPSGGFTGNVTVSASGLPTGAAATFGTNPIVGGSGSSTLSVTTSSTTPTGTYTLTITGTSGTLSHSTTVTLVVNSAVSPSFSISASPSSQTVTAGNSTSYTATVTPSGGFTAGVSLSASGLPSGASATFSPATIAGGSGSSTMSVTTSSTTPTGTYTLTITGTSGALSHSTTVTLVVNSANQGFTISVSPASQTVARGNGTTYTVTVGATGGFNGTVTFQVRGLPSNSTASFSPTSVAGHGTSTMTVTTNSSTSTGTFNLRIRGTSGGATHSATVQLVVQ